MPLVTVKRIVQGYPFVHRLVFSAPDGSAPAMADITTATRLQGMFLSAADPSLPVIGTIDSADGSLQAIDAVTLRLNLPAVLTGLFPLTGVSLAFARLDGSTWSPLPIVFPAWPVRGSPLGTPSGVPRSGVPS